jgi:hypothetical protein
MQVFIDQLRELTAPGTTHGALLNSLYTVQDAQVLQISDI